ncbi:DNA polymerase III subunit gamma/tau [Candidatus Uhrbacteria bacterium]|nr:DNA polymerase III subunit gamma/tau [Candidatus Uhrbacteria bacterium]
MSLYRKYRPLTFAAIAGQGHIKRTLENEIIRDELAHAYIFSGPRAVGKTSTARVFARALNCSTRVAEQSEPCNSCDRCTAILQNRTLDIIEIDAASHTGVDNVRENIIAAARVAKTMLPYKVFIIDEVHMLSTSAFNALLKLLEEPPSSVIFILATTEIQKVPATIISRCQRFDFMRITPADMKARLMMIVKQEEKTLDESVYDDIIRLSDGCQRDAESLLGQILALHDTKIDAQLASLVLPHSNRQLIAKLLDAIAARKTDEAISLIDAMIADGVDIETVVNDTIEDLRSLLRIQSGAGDTVQEAKSVRESLEELSKKLSSLEVLMIADYFAQCLQDIRLFAHIQLPFEIAVVKSCLRAQ